MLKWRATKVILSGLLVAVATAQSTLGSYQPEIAVVDIQTPSVPVAKVFRDMTHSMWNLFWDKDHNQWNKACNGQGVASLWDVSVANDISMFLWEYQKTISAAASFNAYLNPQVHALSASTSRDMDIYADDNSQAIFALLSAYAQQPTPETLQLMKDILSYLGTQVNPSVGGITWKYQHSYVALISTLEAAMAAMKVHYYVRDNTYLEFAKAQVLWIIDNLLDPQDHLIWDGIDANSKEINKGKLSYTMGVAISVMSLLSRNDNLQNWQDMALELAVRALDAGHLNGAFFRDGHLQDPLKYSHHLIGGLADLLAVTQPKNSYQAQAYVMINRVITRETRYLYDKFGTSVIQSNTCPSVAEYTSLLDYASLANVFWQASKALTNV